MSRLEKVCYKYWRKGYKWNGLKWQKIRRAYTNEEIQFAILRVVKMHRDKHSY